MSDPIEILLAEHREIMAEVAPLRRALEELRTRGVTALPTLLPALRGVSRMMTERLPIHARKEDDALFAVLEESLGDGGPSTMMREEHRAIHERAHQFRAILHELEETEHPAIVDAGARLSGMLRRGADAASMAEAGERVVELLDAHFEKEERILFPMAREVLDARGMTEVAARVEAIEREAAESPPR